MPVDSNLINTLNKYGELYVIPNNQNDEPRNGVFDQIIDKLKKADPDRRYHMILHEPQFFNRRYLDDKEIIIFENASDYVPGCTYLFILNRFAASGALTQTWDRYRETCDAIKLYTHCNGNDSGNSSEPEEPPPFIIEPGQKPPEEPETFEPPPTNSTKWEQFIQSLKDFRRNKNTLYKRIVLGIFVSCIVCFAGTLLGLYFCIKNGWNTEKVVNFLFSGPGGSWMAGIVQGFAIYLLKNLNKN